MRNLGPKSREMLESVGIETISDLRETGSIGAAAMLIRAGHRISLNMVYAIEGAIEDIDWRELPQLLKLELTRAFRELNLDSRNEK